MRSIASRRIVFFQSGNYAEAYLRFAEGGAETYRDQRLSVDFVAGLAPENEVTTISFGKTGPEQPRHDRELAPGLRAIAAAREEMTPGWLARTFDRLAPDLLICRSPNPDILSLATRRGVATLPCFADTFSKGGLRSRWRNRRLAGILRRFSATCNHSLNASRSLVTVLGLSPDRVVPWDWRPVPVRPEPKTKVRDPDRPHAVFAGVMSKDKGVGDCLAALAILSRRGRGAAMSFAGAGDLDMWRTKAEALGVTDRVRFLGQVSNSDVRDLMASADMVMIPSRHNYPEGLPNTIYEGLASRSPLVISDHPAFSGRLEGDRDALVFKAGDPESLARAIDRLATDSGLYFRLSERATDTHDGLYIGLEWTRLIRLFLDDPHNETNWVARNSLAALPVPSGNSRRAPP